MLENKLTGRSARKLMKGSAEGGDATESAFRCYIIKSIFWMLMHQGYALFLYA